MLHSSNYVMKGFRIALQMKFEPAFDRDFYGKGEVKMHEAALNMNENDEVWTSLKFQLDFFWVH